MKIFIKKNIYIFFFITFKNIKKYLLKYKINLKKFLST